jgi:hypothetical protein
MSARLVAMDGFLLGDLIDSERDGLTAQMCRSTAFMSRVLALPGLAFALLDGGEVVAGAGLVPMWHGRAEAWQLTSRHARPRQLVAAARIAARELDRRQCDPAFRRIEIYVLAGARWCASFVAALGFEREGLLRRWDPAGRDMWICGRVREVSP